MFQHSLHLSEPRIPPKEPYNPEIRNKNTSRVEWRKVNQRKYRRNLKLQGGMFYSQRYHNFVLFWVVEIFLFF